MRTNREDTKRTKIAKATKKNYHEDAKIAKATKKTCLVRILFFFVYFVFFVSSRFSLRLLVSSRFSGMHSG
jgi:hypothetical protein